MGAWGTDWKDSDWVSDEILDLIEPTEKNVKSIMQQYNSGKFDNQKWEIIDQSRVYLSIMRVAYEAYDFYPAIIDYKETLKFINNLRKDLRNKDIYQSDWENPEEWRASVLKELQEVENWLQDTK